MKRLLALILVLQSSTSLAQTATEPEATTVQMGDDGYVEVPLEFEFSLFEELFSTSWMYDNGIISFIQPGQPGSISPWQWNATPIDQVGANYFIASLWADIAPTSITKYTYSGDATQMKYTWSNIAEFYSAGSPSPRYSTFSTTIKPDGTISTSFASVNLQTSNISSGVVGNKSAGEFQSFYYGSYGSPNTMTDWTYVGTYVPPPPPPPPYVPPEPTYVAPVVEDTTAIVEEPAVQQAVTTQITADPIVETTKQTVAAETPVTSSPVEQTAQAAALSPAEKKSGPGVDAQSIARNNQKALATLTDSVVSSSIQGSIEAGAASAEASLAVSSSMSGSSSGGSSSSSIYGTSESSSSTSNSTKTTNSSIVESTLAYSQNSTSSSESASNLQNGISSIDSTTTSVDSSLLQPRQLTQQESDTSVATVDAPVALDSVLELFKPAKGSSSAEAMEAGAEIFAIEEAAIQYNTMQDMPTQAVTDDINPTSVRGLASMTLAPRFIEEEEPKEEPKEPQLEDKGLAELAESGVRMDALQVVPVGYFNYLNLAYKDVAFYKDRKIYRKQKVVDNLRILRAINARDNKIFSSMINSQYNLEDF